MDDLLYSSEESETKNKKSGVNSRMEGEKRTKKRAKSLAPREEQDNFKEKKQRAQSVFSRPEVDQQKQPIEKKKKEERKDKIDTEKKKIEKLIAEIAQSRERVDQEVEQLKKIKELILKHPHSDYNSLTYRKRQIEIAVVRASKLSIMYQCLNIDSNQHKEDQIMVKKIKRAYRHLMYNKK